MWHWYKSVRSAFQAAGQEKRKLRSANLVHTYGSLPCQKNGTGRTGSTNRLVPRRNGVWSPWLSICWSVDSSNLADSMEMMMIMIKMMILSCQVEICLIVQAYHAVNGPDNLPSFNRNIHCVSKKGTTLTMATTLSILDQFAIFFHWCKKHIISNKTYISLLTYDRSNNI